MTNPPMPAISNPATSYLALGMLLLRRRRFLLWCGVLTAFVVGVNLLLRPRSYTVASAFAPQTQQTPAALSGFAAQFSLALPSGEVAQSPQFFEYLIRTRDLLDEVVTTPFELDSGPRSKTTTLVEYYKLLEGTSNEKIALAENRLLADLRTRVHQKTGVIHLEVTMASPTLALAVNQRVLDLLDRYNRERRRSQATAEREFVERRLDEERASLRRVESELQGFLEANRDLRSSPALLFEQERLRRELSLRQQVLTTILQSYEQARMEEVRNTPLLSIVEVPKLPLQPDRRGLVAKSLLAFMLGISIASALLLLASMVHGGMASTSDEAEAWSLLLREVADDARNPWRLLFLRRRGTA
jgi:uncharacterized protein involved in exopolysaccharide biosynthesis